MNLDLAGQTVHRIALDYAVTLLLEGDVEIRIETAFSLHFPGGQTVIIEPERPGSAIEHLVDVLHHVVTDAVAHDTGRLVLDFANGAHLEVAPDKSYEAWAVAGPRGRKVIALPGGQLAIWGPHA